MVKKFLLSLAIATAGGCVSFLSPYLSFVDGMDTYVHNNQTINKLKEYDGHGIASDKYLLAVEPLNNGYSKYHYAHPNIWGRYCYYYFEVNDISKKVTGWGFDYEKSDPKKDCGRSG